MRLLSLLVSARQDELPKNTVNSLTSRELLKGVAEAHRTAKIVQIKLLRIFVNIQQYIFHFTLVNVT